MSDAPRPPANDGVVRLPPARVRLPYRREAVTVTLATGPQHYDASLGFAADGAVREVFLAGARDGSEMAAILADAAVLISVALQYGVPAAALARSLSRLPLEYGGGPASVIGGALDLVLREEDCPDWEDADV
jgi:hypothetical protein